MAGAMPLASIVSILLMSRDAKRRTKFHGHGLHQYGIHLMVDEIVHFQYSSLETFSIAQNALLELLHIFFLFISRLSVFLSGMAEMWGKDNTKK